MVVVNGNNAVIVMNVELLEFRALTDPRFIVLTDRAHVVCLEIKVVVPSAV